MKNLWFLSVILLLSACKNQTREFCPSVATSNDTFVNNPQLTAQEKVKKASCSVYAQFYVSTLGNDANPGTKELPFKTVNQARLKVRTVNKAMTGDILVNIEPGKYYLEDTLKFDEQDSGYNGCRVVYKNAPQSLKGSAEFIGGVKVTQWQLHEGQIYKTKLSGFKFETLYENSERALKARYPDKHKDARFKLAQAPYLFSKKSLNSSYEFEYGEDDLQAEINKLTNINDLQVYVWSGGWQSWFTDTVPVESIDKDKRRIKLKYETRYIVDTASRYFIQGAYELLTEPGEFYFDSVNETLYYWPRSFPIESQNIVIPKLKTLLSVKGKNSKDIASNITFEGLSFSVTDFTSWYRYGWPRDGQSGENHIFKGFDRQIDLPENRLGAITLEFAEKIQIKYSHIYNTGFNAIYMLFHNGFHEIYGNFIEKTGYNGIKIQGQYPGEGFVSGYNILSNNLISQIGELGGGANAVEISSSGFNDVSYNEIYDTAKSGLFLFTGNPICGELIYSKENNIHHTKFERVVQDANESYAIYFGALSNDNTAPNRLYQLYFNDIKMHADAYKARDWPPGAIGFDGNTWTQYVADILSVGTQNFPYSGWSKSLYNVSWQPGFNINRMELDQIGLKADFPAEYRAKSNKKLK